MPHEKTDSEKSWEDLDPNLREAIIKEGRDRIFWENVYARIGWLKGAVTIFLTLAAGWAALKSGVLEWTGGK